MNLFLLIIIVLVVYYLIKNKKKVAHSNNFKKSINQERIGNIRFERYRKNQSDIQIGENVKLWNRPDSNQINIYERGTVGGDGLLGFTNNLIIANHLSNSGICDATISEISYSAIELKIILKNETISSFEDWEQEKIIKIKNQLNKKFSPKIEWPISFIMPKNFTKMKKFVLNYKSIEEVNKNLSSLDYLDSCIWLEDTKGNKIEII